MIASEPKDPYRDGKVTLGAFAAKTPLRARVVAVLRGQVPDRGMKLIPQLSRAIRRGDVHEVVVTDGEVAPGGRVSQVAYMAFVEFLDGGVLLREDSLSIGGKLVGRLLGFDLSHSPNHMNLVIEGCLRSGEDLGIRVGDVAEFTAACSTKS